MKKDNSHLDNTIAAYLDGTASPSEVRSLLKAVKKDSTLREIMDIVTRVDEADEDAYPMFRMAAETKDNLCDFRCELFILRKHGISYNETELLSLARKNEWLNPSGTPLHAIGQLLASQGLNVSRQYDASLQDIQDALQAGNDVIAVIDSDKIYPERPDEEDAPNHAVVVLAVNESKDCITLYEPDAYGTLDFSLSDFLSAWHESHNYLIYTQSDPKNAQKIMNKQVIAERCLNERERLLQKYVRALPHEQALSLLEISEIIEQLETEYKQFLKRLWEEIKQDDSRSLDDILDKRYNRYILNHDYAEDIRTSQAAAEEITLWEQITNTNSHDIDHLNALISAYATDLLAHITLDFVDDVQDFTISITKN